MNEEVKTFSKDDVYLCGCGGFLKLSHVDDVGTEWFKCEGCSKQVTRLELERNRAKTLEALRKEHEELTKSLTVDELKEILGTTVKHDDENKVITFLAMLLTYTEEDQINLGFLAESSTGKSYIPLELSWYFPKEDSIKLGYASPTAFFHEYGTLMDKDGKPIEFHKRPFKPRSKDYPSQEKYAEAVEKYNEAEKEWREQLENSYMQIDLSHKILIFLDQPHDLLLQRLRSLLSHDEKDIILKITDKREKYGLKTKTVMVKGYPTVVFCTAKFSMADQEKTRLLLLSPEINQEKLRESIALKIEKESDREAFHKRMMEDPERKLLKDRVDLIRAANIKYVKIPGEKREQIYTRFMENHKFLIPRHQRDITRLLAIIKGHTLLNFAKNERIGDTVVINEEDVEAGFRLYYGVSEANELGLSPEVWNVFEKIKTHITENGITINDFQKIYSKEFHKRLGYEDSRRVLKTLCSVALLTEISDKNDKRIRRYTLLESGVKEEKEEAEKKIYPQAEKSIVSVYEALRNNFKEPFYEQKALDLIIQLRNCDLTEAEKLFQMFVDESKLFRDAYGLWSFV